jgi:hypothetical protein
LDLEKTGNSFHRITWQNNGITSPLPVTSESFEWLRAPSLDEGGSVAAYHDTGRFDLDCLIFCTVFYPPAGPRRSNSVDAD